MAVQIDNYTGTNFPKGVLPQIITKSPVTRGNNGRIQTTKGVSEQFGLPHPMPIDQGRVKAEEVRREKVLSQLPKAEKYYPIVVAERGFTLGSGAINTTLATDPNRIAANAIREQNRQLEIEKATAEASAFYPPTVYNPALAANEVFLRKSRAHTSRMQESFVQASLSLQQKKRDADIISRAMEESSAYEDAKIAKKAEISARVEKVKTISLGVVKGVTTAVKKISLTGARIIKSGSVVAGTTIGAIAKAELGASKVAQQMINAGVATGADPTEVAKLGYALAPFGGNQKTAAGFYAKLNQLVEGELYDEASPFRKAALDYGLNITGSGTGGMATKEEMMRNLADWFQEQSKLGNKDSIARMASIIGLDPSMVRLLSLGNEEMGTRLEKADKLVDKQAIENLDKLAQVSGEFSSRLQAASMKLLAFSGVTERVIGLLDKYALTPAEEVAEGIKQGGFVDDLKELGWAQSWFYSNKQKAHALGISEEQFERYLNFKGVDTTIDDEDERYMFLQDLRNEFSNMKISGSATLNDSTGNPIGEVNISVGAESVINQAE